MERKRKTRASRSERCNERDGDEAAENECEADATKKDGGGRMKAREGWAGRKGEKGLTIFICFGRSGKLGWAGLLLEPKQERPARTVMAREIALISASWPRDVGQ
jgi:hypothetical protein